AGTLCASKKRWHTSMPQLPPARGVSKRSAETPLAHPPDGVTGPRPEWVSLVLRDRAGEKIKDGRHVGLDFYDLLIEGRRATALRCWSDIVPAEDVADRSIRNRMAQIRQCAHNPVISPATVFARQADHECLHLP